MQELPASAVSIDDPFWSPRLLTNARSAIFHQWQQLESTGCIDNFRIAAGEKEGFREGWFFADSDAYKWLEAAARIQAGWPNEELKALMDGFIALLARAQMPDGYIYTYNQIHFPGERWGNLMIEHELYCHGHLIEAAVSHSESTGESTALAIARKSADLLVRDFMDASAEKTSGHEEIEIALLRLYQVTQHAPYLDLARQFLYRRGRVKPFFPLILQQNDRASRRGKAVQVQRQAYLQKHPEHASFQLPPNNYAKKDSLATLRWAFNTLSGKYFQQHTSIYKQTVPVGHSVRFGYLETAVTMLARLEHDPRLRQSLEKVWDRMVSRRMYITGGLGSRPEIEGFGRDDELDPELAYAETCASLASLFWNWELTQLSGYAQYADLFEWQLYNAAAVGMGLDGDDYLYNNPLLCRGGIARLPWFKCPCCPSNLSRTWASLGKYIYLFDASNIWVHQYIGSQTTIPGHGSISLRSGFPWDGKVEFRVDSPQSAEFTLHLRIPSWAGKIRLSINGEPIQLPTPPVYVAAQPTASGFDPRRAWYLPLQRTWASGDRVEMELGMPLQIRTVASRVRGHAGKAALTRGPLVYCLESCDNPHFDIFEAPILPDSVEVRSSPTLLGGIHTLYGKTAAGQDFVAIPYSLWANRGESQMTVWINL